MREDQKKENINQTNDGEDKKKKGPVIIAIIAAIMAISIAAWITIKGDEKGTSQDQTAEIITQEETPTAQPGGDKNAITATTTLPNGEMTTYLKAPPHVTGIPDEVAVDRGLAEHDPNEPLPADPREGIKPTLTAPTTARVNGEGPRLTDPSVGSPDFLAKSFFNSVFSLCIKPDTSYNKQMREKYGNIVTPGLKERGLSWGDENHSADWKSYEDPKGCNQLISFPTINGTTVGGSNIIYYDVTVNQRVAYKTTRGGTINTDSPAFRGNIKMVYVNDKWLVDDFQVNGGKMPTIR